MVASMPGVMFCPFPLAILSEAAILTPKVQLLMKCSISRSFPNFRRFALRNKLGGVPFSSRMVTQTFWCLFRRWRASHCRGPFHGTMGLSL